MKKSLIVLLVMTCGVVSLHAQGKSIALKFTPVDVSKVNIEGHLGEKIDLCIAERVVAQDVDHLIEPFRNKTESRFWQSEFWGKWAIGAVNAYRYTGDADLLAKISKSVDDLIATQLPNGYIGNYPPENQLTNWDIWGRKYCILGLTEYYRETKDRKALKAAMRVADHLMTQIGPDATNIIKTGNYRGMASSSVLEPMVYLYELTGKERYLDFANYIVSQWETEEGPKLIGKALENVPVSQRFAKPEVWWSWENGQKAYEMMSCYDGLLQLYLITGKKDYLTAVEKTVANIIETEINISGSGSAFECWFDGAEKQTRPTYHNMETCVTTTWMKLCQNMLELTGNVKYADQIEITTYNALLASMKYDGSQIAKYSPLEGFRQEGEEQCGMHINCCNANGPRGYVQLPRFALLQSGSGIAVNLYESMNAQVEIKGTSVQIAQETQYPKENTTVITLNPEKETSFDLALRIPEWSKVNQLSVNGKSVDNIIPGAYKTLSRTWKKGDKIELTLDLRGRVMEQDNHQAIMMGPVVLARDTRFKDGYIDQPAKLISEDGYVRLTPAKEKPEQVWLAFEAPMVLGTDMESEFSAPKPVKLSDFGSAGNTWQPDARYRVWLEKPINVMSTEYTTY